MYISTFDIFKIGIGPSSSHTMGPMIAAGRFLSHLRQQRPQEIKRLEVRLHGALAFTGKGHGTDRAVVLGLAGFLPETIDFDEAEKAEALIRSTCLIRADELGKLIFDPEKDLVFDYGAALPGHPNGLVFKALGYADEVCATQTYYSIGGGFVLSSDELKAQSHKAESEILTIPYPFKTAAQMLAMGDEHKISIAAMKRANEVAGGIAELDERLNRIWLAMTACMDRGLRQTGILPGGLKVKRRAAAIYEQLNVEKGSNKLQPHNANDWMMVYAMAINEENAAGGKVVTSPTNGAAGVVPAVIRYYLGHCVGASREKVSDFLLVAAAIGGLIKFNASISGAEVGCQGEVGSAAAMAAAGLCAVLGGSNAQIENAAEIALEHHLGMTCDPAGGLVQVPCIERNGLGAVKAVSAASLALRGDGSHFIPLDNCIETMRQTGRDMSAKYKETSQGGLAVNLPEC